MTGIGRTGKYLLAVSAGVLALALVAGVIQSWRVKRRLPAIDMLANGSLEYVDYLISRRQDERAIEQLQLLLRLLPDEPETHEYLGVILGREGRPAEARVQFEEVVRLRPNYAEGYNFLGSTYFDMQQYRSAEVCYRRAVELKPEFPLAYNNLGKAAAHLGDLEVAEKCFARAVELAPDLEEARVNLNWARQQLSVRP